MRLIDADALVEKTDDRYTLHEIGRRERDDIVDAIEYAPTIDAVEVVRCGKCRHYQGNHDVPGCAPCDFWGIGAVMWDDYCKSGERWDK